MAWALTRLEDAEREAATTLANAQQVTRVAEQKIAQLQDAAKASAQLFDQVGTWKARIAAVLNTSMDMHDIEAAVNRFLRRAEEIDRDRMARSVTLDAQTAELEALRRQVSEANAKIDRLENTTQEQLDKFMSACADQAIQIMELRGERIRLAAKVAAFDRAEPMLKLLRGMAWGTVWQASDITELRDGYLAWEKREQAADAAQLEIEGDPELAETDPANIG